MTKTTGAANMGVASLVAILLAVTSTPGGSASARAASTATVAPQAQTSDVGARRHQRPRYRDVSRPTYSSYYGRPYYYAPAPFVPIPPFFGYGWEPW
jgi:hypothetical protein